MTGAHKCQPDNAGARMNRTPEEWALVKADAVVAGSSAQARNVLQMALDDIAGLSADRDRTARNRDMWKGQCERQAEQLSRSRDISGRKELSKKGQVLSEIEHQENETANDYVSDNGQFGMGA